MDTMSNTTVPRLTIGQFLKSVVDLRIRFDPHLWMLTSLVRRNFVTLARGSPRGFDPQIKILPFSYHRSYVLCQASGGQQRGVTSAINNCACT